MTLDDWYDAAREDVKRRGLTEMTPLIDGLRAAARQLREADWNDDARGQAVPPPRTTPTHAS